MRRILVLGGGFAGLWTAVGAARKRDDESAKAIDVEILLIDRQDFHNIRVRNYETDLTDVAVPFAEVLDPIGVVHRVAEVQGIDPARREVALTTRIGPESVTYDRLVLALGSALARQSFDGAEHVFDVDTYAAGLRLNAHVASLSTQQATPSRDTVIVAGAGFTGFEVAAEMREKLRRSLGERIGRIVLVDPNPVLAPGYSEEARALIAQALDALGVELRLGAWITRADPGAVTLASGEALATQTLVWCAGLRPSPLAAALPAAHDAQGRLLVDEVLRVPDVPHVFAAGDAASCRAENGEASVMSCQHARPMGRFAGHNAMADLLGLPLLPLAINRYVTVLDLGRWGALYTVGRDRRVLSSGAAAKAVKQTINCSRIYPPRTGLSADILAAGAPVVQAPPAAVAAATERG